jgi:hypothetical protein
MNGVINLKEPAEPATRHGCGYLSVGFGNPAPIITSAYAVLENVQFDTMVCCGTSGLLVAPILSRAMGRHLAVVRKGKINTSVYGGTSSADNSHSIAQVEGMFGRKWIFVDDLIGSGSTLVHVAESIRDLMSYAVPLGDPEKVLSEFMGCFLYNAGCRYVPVNNCARWLEGVI